jgi:hypothetical protein
MNQFVFSVQKYYIFLWNKIRVLRNFFCFVWEKLLPSDEKIQPIGGKSSKSDYFFRKRSNQFNTSLYQKMEFCGVSIQ